MLYTLRLADGQEFGPAAMDLVLCWASEGRIPVDALLVPEDGGEVRSVLSEPRLATILQAPPTISAGVTPHVGDDDPISKLIPHRNPFALTAYYLGLFSLIPGTGFLLGPAGLILRVIGLRRRARDPHIKGAAHAWTGIICGLLSIMIHYGAIVSLIVYKNM